MKHVVMNKSFLSYIPIQIAAICILSMNSTSATSAFAQDGRRYRFRDLGMAPGVLPPGPQNAITDVEGVAVGHFTWHEGTDIHTGVTAIIPHSGNVFQDKVPAGIAIGNAFGKLAGSTQVEELGEIETPILLTNTLSVSRGMDALLDYTLSLPGNEDVRSVNGVVGETNDGYLNDIRRRVLQPDHFLKAIANASATLLKKEVSEPAPERLRSVGKAASATARASFPNHWADTPSACSSRQTTEASSRSWVHPSDKN